MDSSADRASYLFDAIVSGHFRQVKFYLDAGYDQDYIDNNHEGKTFFFLLTNCIFSLSKKNTQLIIRISKLIPVLCLGFVGAYREYSSYTSCYASEGRCNKKPFDCPFTTSGS